jgi:xanthine dehydrogenase accessory factor
MQKNELKYLIEKKLEWIKNGVLGYEAIIVHSPEGKYDGEHFLINEGEIIPENKENIPLRVPSDSVPFLDKTDEWEIFYESVNNSKTLVIYGAGHIGRALYKITNYMFEKIIVIDQRKDLLDKDFFEKAELFEFSETGDNLQVAWGGNQTAVVIAMSGHSYDREALKQVILKIDTAYTGMIGSIKKIKTIFEILISEGIQKESLEKVFSPMGLDIGAETPEEIAISILGEIIAVFNGKTGGFVKCRKKTGLFG